MFYALKYDTTTGNCYGMHTYSETPASLPAGEIACTEVQAQTPMAYQVVNGALVESVPYAQGVQINALRTASAHAEQTPVTLTLSSGISATFGMTPHDWTKIVGLFSKYSVGKSLYTLPSGYAIPDVNGVMQTITVTDIENLMNAGESQINGALSRLSGLVAQVEAAPTVTEIKAVTW